MATSRVVAVQGDLPLALAYDQPIIYPVPVLDEVRLDVWGELFPEVVSVRVEVGLELWHGPSLLDAPGPAPRT